MTEVLLERINRPHALIDYIRPQKTVKRKQDNSAKILIERIQKREWVEETHEELLKLLFHLRAEAFYITHLPKCHICQMELQLDVERYLGKHITWWVALEDSDYLEETYPDIPKESDYHIGNYWEQVVQFRKTGDCNVPGENTMEFIFARAKWALKIYSRQIHVTRQMLKLIRNWTFTKAIEKEYEKYYDEITFFP